MQHERNVATFICAYCDVAKLGQYRTTSFARGKCILIATKQYAYKETDDIFMISWKMGIVKWQGKKRIIYCSLKHIIKCIQKALHNTK